MDGMINARVWDCRRWVVDSGEGKMGEGAGEPRGHGGWEGGGGFVVCHLKPVGNPIPLFTMEKLLMRPLERIWHARCARTQTSNALQRLHFPTGRQGSEPH